MMWQKGTRVSMQVLPPSHAWLSSSLLLPHNLFTLSILYSYKYAPCTLTYPIALLYNLLLSLHLPAFDHSTLHSLTHLWDNSFVLSLWGADSQHPTAAPCLCVPLHCNESRAWHPVGSLPQVGSFSQPPNSQLLLLLLLCKWKLQDQSPKG